VRFKTNLPNIQCSLYALDIAIIRQASAAERSKGALDAEFTGFESDRSLCVEGRAVMTELCVSLRVASLAELKQRQVEWRKL